MHHRHIVQAVTTAVETVKRVKLEHGFWQHKTLAMTVFDQICYVLENGGHKFTVVDENHSPALTLRMAMSIGGYTLRMSAQDTPDEMMIILYKDKHTIAHQLLNENLNPIPSMLQGLGESELCTLEKLTENQKKTTVKIPAT
jgi:hypothetical protein